MRSPLAVYTDLDDVIAAAARDAEAAPLDRAVNRVEVRL